jgi:4-azaleucine resistance transporter AzlC
MDKHNTIQKRGSKDIWWMAVTQALPVMLGYLPIGFAYGVLAQKAGLSPFNTLLMSTIVFAGSAQLIAVELFTLGLDPITIILTTFVVNLRHLLMSASLSPHVDGWKKMEKAGFAFELTDETFALHSLRAAQENFDRKKTFTINFFAHGAWILGTGLGVILGTQIINTEPLALDYALPAMFIALLVMQLKTKPQVLVAVLSGMLSVGLYMLGLDRWYVIFATIIGASIGVWVERWMKT